MSTPARQAASNDAIVFAGAIAAAPPWVEYFGSFMLPRGFEPKDITGWPDRLGGLFEASRQLQQGYHLELAHPVPGQQVESVRWGYRRCSVPLP
jgi:hypothetical protein